jgi:hypothetical protein
VLASALPAQTYQRTGVPATETFGGGIVFDGEQATAVVALGAAVTPQPIVFQVVDQVSCSASVPSCPAPDAAALTGAGTMGVLGTGLRGYAGYPIYDPIGQLASASRSYSIHLTSATTGTLAIGLDASVLAMYHSVQLGADAAHPDGSPAWNDLSVPACYALAGAPVGSPCAAEALVDTGTNVLVLSDGAIPANEQSGSYVAAGLSLEISIPGVLDWMTQTTTHELYDAASLGSVHRILGLPFFRANDVAYDLNAGTVGFRGNP